MQSIVAPEPSLRTIQAQENRKKRRSRVQAKEGEVLTLPESLKRLKQEAIKRAEKQNNLTARFDEPSTSAMKESSESESNI